MTSIPTDEERLWLDDALAHFGRSRDPALRDEIATAANWLAVRGARRFLDRGEHFDDLLQVARIGLLKAIDRFDSDLGVPFGAFATPTIMGELRRYFRDHTWSVHVSRRAKDLRPGVNSAVDELSKDLARSPTVPEIAQRLRISEDAVLEALEANHAYRASSLDPQAAGTAASAVVQQGFDDVLDHEIVRELLVHLRPRERTILYLRFYEELSQAQIAERIGTSQVHVGRLISSSLAELRRLAAEAVS